MKEYNHTWPHSLLGSLVHRVTIFRNCVFKGHCDTLKLLLFLDSTLLIDVESFVREIINRFEEHSLKEFLTSFLAIMFGVEKVCFLTK